MPVDIINSICDAITKKEENENIIAKFKEITIAIIKEKEKEITINNEENDNKIDDFIFNYIRNK